MTKYDIIFEALQDRVNNGELTVEEAEVLNDVAFEKYGEDELFNEGAFKKYREIVDDSMNNRRYIKSIYDDAPKGTKLKKQLSNKLKDAEKKENRIRSNYKKYIEDDHICYKDYKSTGKDRSEDTVIEDDIKSAKRFGPDIDGYYKYRINDHIIDRKNSENHKKYGFTDAELKHYGFKRTLGEQIRRKKDKIGPDEPKRIEYRLYHKDLADSESYKLLKKTQREF